MCGNSKAVCAQIREQSGRFATRKDFPMARWIAGVCLGLSLTQETFGFFWGSEALPGTDIGNEIAGGGNLSNETEAEETGTSDTTGDRFEWWIFSTFWGYGRWNGARSSTILKVVAMVAGSARLGHQGASVRRQDGHGTLWTASECISAEHGGR